MTAVEDNNLFNHFSVIALRKENKTLQENNLNLKCENFELEQRLKACNDFNNLNNKSLKEIFTAPAWKEMTDAWSTKNHELRTCWKKCKNSKWKVSNTSIVSADHFK